MFMLYFLFACAPSAKPTDSAAGSPVLLVSPETLAVGDVGTSPATASDLTLSNAGDAELDVTLSVQSAGLGLTVGTASLVLPPGTEQTVTVTLAPTGYGAISTAVLLGSNDPARPSLQVPYIANVLAPDLVGGPEPLTFGDVTVGTSAEETLTLENHGPGDAVVQGMVFDDATFVATAAFPLTIPEGGADEVTVTASPTAEGEIRSLYGVIGPSETGPLGQAVVTGVP
jgi:hypothetical protein